MSLEQIVYLCAKVGVLVGIELILLWLILEVLCYGDQLEFTPCRRVELLVGDSCARTTALNELERDVEICVIREL